LLCTRETSVGFSEDLCVRNSLIITN